MSAGHRKIIGVSTTTGNTPDGSTPSPDAPSGEPTPPPRVAGRPGRDDVRIARILAAFGGLLGFLLLVAVPFLPVKQETTEFSWPRSDGASVEAPLVSYIAERLRIEIPAAAADAAEEDTTLVSTLPVGAPGATSSGLTVRRLDDSIEVATANRLLYSVPTGNLRDAVGPIVVDADLLGVTVTGIDGAAHRSGPETRPMVVGLFSDAPDVATSGMSAHVTVDSRFTSSPSVAKLSAIVIGALATIISLGALHRLDGRDGRRHRRLLPRDWWKPRPVDGVVIAALTLWHVIGATTSDDGYLITMARASEEAGYMANYYRWLGVPESPVGWYYEVFAALGKISTASMWLRLPTLLTGIVAWLLLRREVLPRLGRAAANSPIATWAAALVFLAFWMPYDNGLRPESIIALAALSTWALGERSAATGRILPGTLAIIIAAFAIAAGPTGVMCVAALAAGLRPYLRNVVRRGRDVGFLPVVAPILAAGVTVLIAVFADQTFASVAEATKVRTAIGPNLPWFHEDMRYIALMVPDAGGSFGRRFPVFLMLLLLVTTSYILARRGRIRGLARGPVVRILGVVLGSLLLLMLTPTKWTHHFGVFAGVGAALAAAAAVALGPTVVRSVRNRWLFAGIVALVSAWSLAAVNDWWFVSQYGVPWTATHPRFLGIGFATWSMAVAAGCFAVAAAVHYSGPLLAAAPRLRAATDRAGAGLGRLPGALRSAALPVVLAAALVVSMQIYSFAVAAVERGDAFSLTRSNLDSLRGNHCALANDVLVETDPTDSVLKPVHDEPGIALGAITRRGFTPDGVRENLKIDTSTLTGVAATTPAAKGVDGPDSGITGGVRDTPGINGSRVRLPYGLDPARVPVLGSYGSGDDADAALTSAWYRLPERSESRPILAIAVAGTLAPHAVTVEYTSDPAPTGRSAAEGSVTPLDPGPLPTWRDLRVPLADLPDGATSVRLLVRDPDLDPARWIAVTAPRVPELRSLDSVVGHTDPVVLDWVVAFQFPCQRPFDHHGGVADIPRWRVLPDIRQIEAANAWQDEVGGGPLGWTQQALVAETVPTFLRHDPARGWGWLQRLESRDPNAAPATLSHSTVQRSGLWTPGPMRR